MAQDSLMSFVESVTDGSRLRVESDLGGGFVRLRVTEAERRQAKQDIRCVEDAVVEMLRNARDAHAHNIFLASSRSGSLRKIVMIDDGDGIPYELWDTVFEPRVTSKLDTMHFDDWGVHGRGMALYSIKQNALNAHVCVSQEDEGSVLSCVFDCNDLPERSDQSTLPELCLSSDGIVLGPGPHNIARVVCEFALAHKDTCTVYLGSPVDIAATLVAFGRVHSPYQSTHLCEQDDHLLTRDVSPFKLLRSDCDPATFTQYSKLFSFEFSERSSRRVLSGDIASLSPILDTLKRDLPSTNVSSVDLIQDYRGLKIHPDDMTDFRHDLKQAFNGLADKYFLNNDVDVSVRVTKEGIKVTFPLEKID